MSNQPTFLHFYTSQHHIGDDGGTSVARDLYSWYLETHEGELLSSSDRRWGTKEEVIADVTATLGEGFWKTEHTVFQDDWFQLLVSESNDEGEPFSREIDVIPPIEAESYLFFNPVSPYGWRLKDKQGNLLESSGRTWNLKKDAIENADFVLGGIATDPTIFVVNLAWRNLIQSGELSLMEPVVIKDLPPTHRFVTAKNVESDRYKDVDSAKFDFDVEVVDATGSDLRICQAARVSTLGADAPSSTESRGLLNFLMKNRHGSPFEHGFMTFRITAPIFVWREFMRHRIGFSYNEQSGRYMQLPEVCYFPDHHRNLVQVGKTGAYSFEPGTDDQYALVLEQLGLAYEQAWSSYHTMLKAGICKEVARVCLPVATYSTAYVSCNPRSLMSFLSLRTQHEDSTFPSFPQWEISAVADKMEEAFKEFYPLTHAAFVANGRVSP